jgi:hypothetical protein
MRSVVGRDVVTRRIPVLDQEYKPTRKTLVIVGSIEDDGKRTAVTLAGAQKQNVC